MPKEDPSRDVDFDRIQSLCKEVMSGHSWEDVQPRIDSLTEGERKALLCTLCGLLEEVRMTSNDHAAECMKVLGYNCQFFSEAGIRCEPDDRCEFVIWFGWKPTS